MWLLLLLNPDNGFNQQAVSGLSDAISLNYSIIGSI